MPFWSTVLHLAGGTTKQFLQHTAVRGISQPYRVLHHTTRKQKSSQSSKIMKMESFFNFLRNCKSPSLQYLLAERLQEQDLAVDASHLEAMTFGTR